MATKIPKDAFTKAFTKTKFAFQLDKAIGEGDFVWQFDYKPKLEDNAWHPSGHCTPSLHELFHFAYGREPVVEYPEGNYPENIEQREIEPQLGKIFAVGHFWHQYLQEVCVRAGFCEEKNVERRGSKGWGEYDGLDWKPFHWVTGSADICPVEVPGHGSYLLDFKTMGSHQFRANEPHPNTVEKWECQLNVYMDFFDMDKAMILGINKDSPHDFKEFEFHRNQPLIETLYDKWKLVSACLDEEIEPPEDEEIELPLQGRVNG